MEIHGIQRKEKEAWESKMAALRLENETLKVCPYRSDTKEHIKYEHAQSQISVLEHDQKEQELRIKELGEENKRMKQRMINTEEFEEWSSEQFAAWIVSLDPAKYGQYEEGMKRMLIEEGVDGQCIDEKVAIADIKRWGIVHYLHSRHVLEEIRKLIQNKKGKQMLSMEEGANTAPTAYL